MENSNLNLILKREHRAALKHLLWPVHVYDQCQHIHTALGFDPYDLYKELTWEFYREQRIMRTAEGIIKNRVTKQQLVDALRAPNVGQRQLAQELEENESINDGKSSSYYCTY